MNPKRPVRSQSDAILPGYLFKFELGLPPTLTLQEGGGRPEPSFRQTFIEARSG